MNTLVSSRTTCLDRDPIYFLEQSLKISNFSSKTIKPYLYYNKELLRFASEKSPKEINQQDIKDYLEFMVDSGKASATLNVAINAIKYYYCKVLQRKFSFNNFGIPRPKAEKKLPTVLSKQEIGLMIASQDNIKHKLMIQVMYCSGMRVSETVDLKIDDIDFDRKMIIIRQGKGNKDRNTIVSQIVLDNTTKYLLEYQPLRFLFEGIEVGTKMSTRSIQKVVSNSAELAGIRKNVSAHTLRHTFATHLLENGVNLRYIQSLLGHSRLETTQIYTKVAHNKLLEIEDLL